MTNECHDHASCVQMFQMLSAFLDEELDAMACENIVQHAGECIACRICIETLKRTIELCKNVETRPVPASFSRRLKETFAAVQPRDLP